MRHHPVLALLRLLAGVVPVALAGAAACGDSSPRVYTGRYISLGDSIAQGQGASDPALGFVELLARDEGNLAVDNLAVGGATTRDVIDRQLPPVLPPAYGGQPAFITISAGFNDVGELLAVPACGQDPAPPACALDDALGRVEENIGEIMRKLRLAYPKTPVVVLLYPNFFSGTGGSWEASAHVVLARLDAALRRVAARYPHTGVAVTAAAFEGKGRTLTHWSDAIPDFHPNDAGHRVIANAFVAALRRVK
jgi:lysophospholipase L1-like esterase